jgi:hypothetical protein
MRMFHVTIGPNNDVTGEKTVPSANMDVLTPRLMALRVELGSVT